MLCVVCRCTLTLMTHSYRSSAKTPGNKHFQVTDGAFRDVIAATFVKKHVVVAFSYVVTAL